MMTTAQFDSNTITAIDAAAQQMQSQSPFTPANSYDLELPRVIDPAALRRLTGTQAAAPLTGRFVRWELCGAELRLQCELDELEPALGAWSCRVGSVAKIELPLWPAFLSAVHQAFPLTDESTFRCVLPAKELLTAAAPSAAPAAAPGCLHPAVARMLEVAAPAAAESARRIRATAAAAALKGRPQCRFYARGVCKHGAACRFAHVDGKASRAPPVPQQRATKIKTDKSKAAASRTVGFAPMDVSTGLTGVTGDAKIQKRRPRRGPAMADAPRP